MSIQGWYYLHVSGDLIYKRDLPGTATDIRDSDFALGLWAMDTADRENAWQVCVEALAGGANPQRISELAAKWGCTDYAARVGIKVGLDGNMWMATAKDFTNLAESAAGFGATKLEAFAELAKALGYQPSKGSGATFRDLLNAHGDGRTPGRDFA